MSPFLIVVASLKALQRNRMRTILKMLGIMAGIAIARRAPALDPVDALRFE